MYAHYNFQTLITLRSIGNIEQSQRFVPTLENCFGNKQNPMEIRVAAVEAYRKMSCGADVGIPGMNGSVLLYIREISTWV